MSADAFRPQYEGTRYLVHYAGASIDARIGVSCPPLDRLLAAEGAPSGVFITAMNPGSTPRPAAENEAATRALGEALRLWTTLPHDGVALDHSWRESGFFVLGIGRAEALALARRFGQNAIVWCERGRPPALLYAREVENGGSD